MKKILKKLFDDKDETKKGYAIRVVVAIVLAIIIAGGFEFLKMRRVLSLPKEQRVSQAVEFSMEGNTLIAEFPRQYVQAIDYSYDADGSMETIVRARTSVPGAPEEYAEHTDNNHRLIRRSVERIGMETDRIELEIYVGDNVTFTSFCIDNRVTLNWRRLAAAFFAAFALALIALCNNYLAKRLEVAVFVIGMCLGGIVLVTSPISKSVWDEGIHFTSSFAMFAGDKTGANEVLRTIMSDDAMSRLNPPKSCEEYKIMRDTVNAQASYRVGEKGATSLPKLKKGFSSIGYIPAGIALAIGRLIGVRFSTLHILGKIVNLLLYLIIIYFAIKRCTIGKRLFAAISLMPTSLYIAASYNRDGMFNALGILGVSYLLSMMAENERIKNKDYIIAAVALALMCALKAIYVPFLLLLLLIPRRRFENEKILWILRGAVILGGLLLIVSFVVPALSSNSSIGDARGGNTSGSEQMKYILGAPMLYARTLWESIKGYQMEYLLGRAIFGNLGVYGLIQDVQIIGLVLLGIAITDHSEYHLKVKDKIAILLACIVMIVFVWTSMYLSFTEVGAATIAGVQGRYFITLVAPLLLLFHSEKIQNSMSERAYNTALSVFMVCFVFIQYYNGIIFYYVA